MHQTANLARNDAHAARASPTEQRAWRRKALAAAAVSHCNNTNGANPVKSGGIRHRHMPALQSKQNKIIHNDDINTSWRMNHNNKLPSVHLSASSRDLLYSPLRIISVFSRVLLFSLYFIINFP